MLFQCHRTGRKRRVPVGAPNQFLIWHAVGLAALLGFTAVTPLQVEGAVQPPRVKPSHVPAAPATGVDPLSKVDIKILVSKLDFATTDDQKIKVMRVLSDRAEDITSSGEDLVKKTIEALIKATKNTNNRSVAEAASDLARKLPALKRLLEEITKKNPSALRIAGLLGLPAKAEVLPLLRGILNEKSSSEEMKIGAAVAWVDIGVSYALSIQKLSLSELVDEVNIVLGDEKKQSLLRTTLHEPTLVDAAKRNAVRASDPNKSLHPEAINELRAFVVGAWYADNAPPVHPLVTAMEDPKTPVSVRANLALAIVHATTKDALRQERSQKGSNAPLEPELVPILGGLGKEVPDVAKLRDLIDTLLHLCSKESMDALGPYVALLEGAEREGFFRSLGTVNISAKVLIPLLINKIQDPNERHNGTVWCSLLSLAEVGMSEDRTTRDSIAAVFKKFKDGIATDPRIPAKSKIESTDMVNKSIKRLGEAGMNPTPAKGAGH